MTKTEIDKLIADLRGENGPMYRVPAEIEIRIVFQRLDEYEGTVARLEKDIRKLNARVNGGRGQGDNGDLEIVYDGY